MRVVKEHDERKNEIIDAAEMLFSTKGYGKCSVNDILNVVGIAKGTFYHYFKSKEEVLDAIVDRTTKRIVGRVSPILEDKAMAVDDKLLQFFLRMRVTEQNEQYLIEEMHKQENAMMHQKSIVSAVSALTPLLTGVVKEGIDKEEYHADYPEAYMEIFLIAANILLDDGFFEKTPEKKAEMLMALIAMLEIMLGVEKGRFLSRAAEYPMNGKE